MQTASRLLPLIVASRMYGCGTNEHTYVPSPIMILESKKEFGNQNVMVYRSYQEVELLSGDYEVSLSSETMKCKLYLDKQLLPDNLRFHITRDITTYLQAICTSDVDSIVPENFLVNIKHSGV